MTQLWGGGHDKQVLAQGIRGLPGGGGVGNRMSLKLQATWMEARHKAP